MSNIKKNLYQLQNIDKSKLYDYLSNTYYENGIEALLSDIKLMNIYTKLDPNNNDIQKKKKLLIAFY